MVFLPMNPTQRELQEAAVKASRCEKSVDMEGACIALTDMGVAYCKLSQFPAAIEQFERALQIAKYMKDELSVGLSHINLG